jgi:hypothetical protein
MTQKKQRIDELLSDFVKRQKKHLRREEQRDMTYDQAADIFDQIGKNKSPAPGKALVQAAVRYARLRVDYLRATPEAKQQIGSERSAAHDAFIAACDELASRMHAAGQDTAWRIELTEDRKTIGDFACYIHCILGIWAR